MQSKKGFDFWFACIYKRKKLFAHVRQYENWNPEAILNSKQASQSAIENPSMTEGKKNDNQIFIGQIDCENIRLAYILNKSRDLMHSSTDDAHSSQTAHLAADVDVSLNVKRLQELNKYFHAYYVKLNIFIGYCRANKLENCSSNNLFTITVKAFWFKTLGKFINQLC